MTTANLLPILDVAQLHVPARESVVPPTAFDAHAIPAKFVTLGCKVNQYETQYVRELLQANGYRDARPGEAAGLAVVNTCTVTAESDSKSRQIIRNFSRDNPGVKVVVMGCYATRDPNAVKRLPGVAAVIEDKRHLEAALQPFGVKKIVRGIKSFDGHQRAFVKVQDGCILDCTFCIIPKVRPGLLSRPMETIAEEVAGLADAGYREIVLTGIHLGHYGLDLSGPGSPRSTWQRLPQLLARLCELPGEFRIRLSSLEATEVTAEFVAVLAANPKRICPHLHLSMQSGSDRILQAMKRRYRIGRFIEKCDRLRSALDQPAFTTDIIVGFPGETDADFSDTLAAVRTIGYSKVHIFPFSARAGTPAATMPNQTRPEVIKERRELLAGVAAETAAAYHRSLTGRTLDMLVESPDPKRPGWMRGTACRYAPLRLRALPALARKLVPVVATQEVDGALEVEPLAELDRFGGDG